MELCTGPRAPCPNAERAGHARTMNLDSDIRRRRIAATHELYSDGWTKKQLARAVARADIIRVRQGWYATPDLPIDLLRAARVGGRVTCVSGARFLGLATRDSPTPHVAVPHHSSRLRSPDDPRSRHVGSTRIHWTDAGGSDRVACTPLECLVEMAGCRPLEQTIAAVDSALRLGYISQAAWTRACRTMPRRLRRWLTQVDRRAASITESITRVRLNGLGIFPRLQVRIPGVGHVDLLIGEALVIEVDGFAYHSDPDDFENDRRRDARLSIRGYRVLRFSYRQVMGHWSEVKAAILAAVARGDHLR